MATHIVCPMCGKSSSLGSFPAKGDAILLQTFRGLGRGRGFRVEEQVDGLENKELCGQVREKAVRILGFLANHGHVKAGDLDAVLPDTSARLAGLAMREQQVMDLRAQAGLLQKELEYERGERSLITDELVDVRSGWRIDRDSLHEAKVRIASLEGRLNDSRRACSQLIEASRSCGNGLRQLREQFAASATGRNALTSFIRDFRHVAELVQEIQTIAQVQELGGGTVAQAR